MTCAHACRKTHTCGTAVAVRSSAASASAACACFPLLLQPSVLQPGQHGRNRLRQPPGELLLWKLLKSNVESAGEL